MSVVVAAALAASPASAAKKAMHKVSCKEIKAAVDSGKSEDQVSKDLNVSAKTVKNCMSPPAKSHRKSMHKAS